MRSSMPGLAVVAALAAGCGGLPPYDGPVTRLDLSACDPSGTFTTDSDHPYLPLEPGRSWTLEGGGERVVITVLDETEEVAGVTTRVVEEREFEDGELSEVSRNFVARAADGTVCYFGEDVEKYEDGEVVSRPGEWRADAPGGRPGILMPAEPAVGMRFAMEAAPERASDVGLIVAVGESRRVPAGTFGETIRIREIDPLDGEEEDKVFARDVGFLVDEDLELVDRNG